MRLIKLVFIIFLFTPLMALSQWQLVHTFPSTLAKIEVVDSVMYAATYLNGIFASYDNGLTWVSKNNNISDTIMRSFYANSSLLMAAVHSDPAINISFDGGNTWIPSGTGMSNPSGVFSISQAGNNLLAGTFGTFAGDSATLNISTNNGISWVQTLSLTPYTGFPAFAVKDNFIAASSYEGVFYYSTDYGFTYTPLSTPFAAEDMVITNSSIVVGTITAGISQIAYSLDNGISWNIGRDFTSAQDFKNSNDTVYAATLSGFCYSFDAGVTWHENNTGLPPSSRCYAVAVKGDFLYIGHLSGGLYKLSLSKIISVHENGTSAPREFILEQNYPNPFNPGTKIRFHIPKTSGVKIIVFDLTGKEVRTLVDQTFKGGSHETGFDASELSSGVYFYKIITSSFIETKKMVLIK